MTALGVWLKKQGPISPVGDDGSSRYPRKIKLEPHRTIYEGNLFRVLNRGLSWLHKVRESLDLPDEYEKMGHQVELVKACYRKGAEKLLWRGVEVAALKSSDNYLNLRVLPICSDELLIKAFKSDHENKLGSGKFNLDELKQSYRDHMSNLN